MDTPIHGKRVGIILDRKRYKCRDCGKTFSPQCGDISDKNRATDRLVKYVEDRAMLRTCTSVAHDIGLTEGTVRNILNSHIKALEAQYSFETPSILGIDEAHLNKKMRLVLTNIEARKIIDLVSDRNKKTVISTFEKLKNKENVKWVAMDMWAPYRDAVYLSMPKAKVVIDKFHVVKMANTAVDAARKSIKADLPADQYKKLKKDKYLMLTRRRDLTVQQQFILSGWLVNHTNLYDVYEAKERFFDIWDNKDYDSHSAYIAYSEWIDSIPTGVKKYFSDIERACRNWHEEIFNYFDKRITNAFTESSNNIIKHMYKQGRGYSFEVLRARVLFRPITPQRSFKSGIGSSVLGSCEVPMIKNYGVDIEYPPAQSKREYRKKSEYGELKFHKPTKKHGGE